MVQEKETGIALSRLKAIKEAFKSQE